MDVYDTIYSIVDANNGKIKGRTAIQKIAYLASKKIPELEVPPYTSHYYGPFSPGLGCALENMVSCAFLYETRTPSAYAGYTYGLTDDGREICGISKKKYGDIFAKVANIVSICKKYCELRITPLSFASKINYMVESQARTDDMKGEDLTEYATKFGWKMNNDDITQGTELLRWLKLVTIRE